MADQKFQPQSTSQTDTDLFVKGMTKDPNASLTGQQNWTHARNAINNSKDGDVGAGANFNDDEGEVMKVFCSNEKVS